MYNSDRKLNKNNWLDKILLNFNDKNISDVHLKSNSKIYYRYLGDIEILDNSDILTNEKIIDAISSVLDSRTLSEFNNNFQVDFSFSDSNSTRYRANLYKTNTGVSLALRKIDSTIKTFEQMMAPEIFKKIANLKKGLVIITGPTGCGKSTTLNTFIDFINENFKKHIITIEDPIEFIHNNKKSLINQREIGKDVKNFNLAIKSALRENPDIILIGELRDAESIKECLTAAETGHLVFTTLHTQSASKTIDRIINCCKSEEKELVRIMLSTTLQAVILQKLMKKQDKPELVSAFEVLLGNNATKNLIKENKLSQIDSIIQTNSNCGMIDMKKSIKNLFLKNYISENEMNNNLIDFNEYE